MATLVFWLGHFIIGYAYYLRYFRLLTEEEWEHEKEKAYAGKSQSHIEMMENFRKNKPFILALYLIVGYINLIVHAKKLLTKKGMK